MKNAIDFVYAEWKRKPVAFVSFGNAGGASGVEQPRLACIELEMAPSRKAVHLFGVHGRWQEGAFAAGSGETKRLSDCLDEFSWWTRALRDFFAAKEIP